MLELALGNLQVKVVLLCSTFCEEVEHEEDITKRETALVKKFFLIWRNRKSNKETKKQRRTSCPLLDQFEPKVDNKTEAITRKN